MSVGRALVSVLTATAISGAALLAVAPAASAKGLEVRASGDCSARTDWKLKTKADDGRLEVEFEVDSNKNGQTWAVTVTDNTVKVYTGSRKTVAPSGSFSVEKVIANRAGNDVIVATARNAATGETCKGALVFKG